MSGIINHLHIFVFVPLLYALYYYRESLSQNICYLLMIIAIAGILYHTNLLYNLPDDKKYKEWVYLLHILVVFPLLFYIGYTYKDTKRKYFEILLIIMFGALGYHTHYLLTK
jgi:hypothetical protein